MCFHNWLLGYIQSCNKRLVIVVYKGNKLIQIKKTQPQIEQLWCKTGIEHIQFYTFMLCIIKKNVCKKKLLFSIDILFFMIRRFLSPHVSSINCPDYSWELNNNIKIFLDCCNTFWTFQYQAFFAPDQNQWLGNVYKGSTRMKPESYCHFQSR